MDRCPYCGKAMYRDSSRQIFVGFGGWGGGVGVITVGEAGAIRVGVAGGTMAGEVAGVTIGKVENNKSIKIL